MKRVLAVVSASLALTACSSNAADGPAGITEVSGRAPALSGTTLQGARFAATDHAGRVLVVNFWATWCGPCREEQPALSSVAAEQGEDGAVFVGVNYRDDAAAARAYLNEFEVAYPSLEDPSGALAYRFGVPYLPATVVVDASGELRFRAVGALDAGTLRSLIGRASVG
ncbi:MAG TPA: TlpA disulfide reductase family protein [Actinomycetota bacterium]|nr:TlpA disulfide reductase family protein [Actinomycetota bacterium]